MTSQQGDQKSDREGMIQVNDLVYKLEPDISVAVNRTHKTHYFQQPEYKNSQTAICILNSGADYIDCRRSFLSFRVDLDSTPFQIQDNLLDSWHRNVNRGNNDVLTAVNRFNASLLVHGYFGPNGSILNLIDTVTVTTRSGDELSRVTDLALLANMTLPLMFGSDWKSTVGQMIGLGESVYGKSVTSLTKHPCADRTYCIPMYLLSPIFQYGRLMPSMLMSGLRITITWKSTTKAFAQYVAKCPPGLGAVPTNLGGFVVGCGFNQGSSNSTDALIFTGDQLQSGGLYNTNDTNIAFRFPPPKGLEWEVNDVIEVLGQRLTVIAVATSQQTVGVVGIIPGDTIGTSGNLVTEFRRIRYGKRSIDASFFSPSWDPSGRPGVHVSCPSDGVDPDGNGVARGKIPTVVYPASTLQYDRLNKPDYWGTGVEAAEESGKRVQFPDGFDATGGGTMVPGYRYKGFGTPEVALPWTDDGGMDSEVNYAHPLALRKYFKNPDFVDVYTVQRPEFSLCSVQLSDAIQRTLNEYSAVNGLEIVYTDYDLTSSPIQADNAGTSVYTEVRKSASRALQAFARVVPSYDSTVEKTSDSLASTIQYAEDIACGASGWKDYQWQLGSLYFPQQKIQAAGPFDFGAIAYAHTLDAFDRFSGSASCMITLRGEETARQSTGLTAVSSQINESHIPGSAPPDLLSQERLYLVGKPGSFLGGGEVISVSLERSSLFNLSGIPINNSRVLALRGHYSSYPTKYCNRHQLNIYLKYVKLARIFLNNVEVEQ